NSELAIKHTVENAVSKSNNIQEKTRKNSSNNKWLEENKKSPKKKRPAPVKSKPTPELLKPDKKLANFTKPMLAKETDKAFDDKNWLFEIKWDGYRAVAEKNKKDIRLYSRNGLDFSSTYPVITDQLQEIREEVIIDGEIVVLNDNGQPDFQMLQLYSENQHRPVQYQVFDLLELNGQNTTGLTLLERKE